MRKARVVTAGHEDIARNFIRRWPLTGGAA